MPGRGFLCGAIDASQCAANLDLRSRVVLTQISPNFEKYRSRRKPLETQKEAWLDGEPTIDDVLSDPIVQTVMRSDGLTYEDVHAAIAVALARLRNLSENPPMAA
jgi:hypothetical protein